MTRQLSADINSRTDRQTMYETNDDGQTFIDTETLHILFLQTEVQATVLI